MAGGVLNSLDRAVIAVRDLPAATQGYAALLGRPPSWRGLRPGAGTASALFRLENTCLELLAPEGEGELDARVREALGRQGEGLLALAFGTDDIEACARELRAAGLAALEPSDGEERDADTGALRRWRSLLLEPGSTRGLWLFAIEQRSAPQALPLPQPAGAAVSALDHVVVASADLEASHSVYSRLGLRLALDRSFEARGLRILFFRVGGVTVEVVGGLRAAPDPAAPDRFGGLAWRVPEADAARARLAAAGFEVSKVRPGAKAGTRVCTVRRETWGVPTLLIESAG